LYLSFLHVSDEHRAQRAIVRIKRMFFTTGFKHDLSILPPFLLRHFPTMPFAFRNQPLKGLYLTYQLITTLFIRFPLWVILSLPRLADYALQPTRSRSPLFLVLCVHGTHGASSAHSWFDFSEILLKPKTSKKAASIPNLQYY